MPTIYDPATLMLETADIDDRWRYWVEVVEGREVWHAEHPDRLAQEAGSLYTVALLVWRQYRTHTVVRVGYL